ncbi:hypothetical protein ACM1RC_32780 [Paenibacillus azoreducens]|uniref:hypothetical protein n=1 Tax=Paenibacillus azoreducens TaxID=116718 RepID=UPI0039F49416
MTNFELFQLGYKRGWADEAKLKRAAELNLITKEQLGSILEEQSPKIDQDKEI